VLSRDQGDHGAGARLVLEIEQRGGDRGDQGLIRAPQHEAQLGRDSKRGICRARVFERPVDELRDEFRREPSVRGAFGAREQDDYGGSVDETIVEQLAGQHVVGRARGELGQVLGVAERRHALARAQPELSRKLQWNRCGEQLLLAREIFVEIADGGARAVSDAGHRGRFVTDFGKAPRCCCDEAVAHVLLRNLSHSKENYVFSFECCQDCVAKWLKMQRFCGQYKPRSTPS
jgi:hypothetical protein